VKPLALMERLVTVAPAGGLVVDPFVGSGSTCIAALRNGRRVIGIQVVSEPHIVGDAVHSRHKVVAAGILQTLRFEMATRSSNSKRWRSLSESTTRGVRSPSSSAG